MKPRLFKHEVLEVFFPDEATVCLTLNRGNIRYEAGHNVLVGVDPRTLRPYSLCSAPSEPVLRLLVRIIPGGRVSQALSACRGGDGVYVSAPEGDFLLPEEATEKQFYFIATGTGIAPFVSMVTACPSLDYRVLHGVRQPSSCYDRSRFAADRYRACLSRVPEEGDFHGRVTDYLRAQPVDPETHYYLCGSCDMIYEVFGILHAQGVPRDHVHVETYY